MFILANFVFHFPSSVFAFLSLSLLDNLLIDYQFTFSLLQEDDRHYTAINFMATPEQVIHAHMGTYCSLLSCCRSDHADESSGQQFQILSGNSFCA